MFYKKEIDNIKEYINDNRLYFCDECGGYFHIDFLQKVKYQSEWTLMCEYHDKNFKLKYHNDEQLFNKHFCQQHKKPYNIVKIYSLDDIRYFDNSEREIKL